VNSPSSKLPCCVSMLSARCDLMLLQSSKAGAVPRRRSCSSTSSQAVAVNSPSSELLCYVSVLSARCDLMLLHSSNGAVPRLLQHQQPTVAVISSSSSLLLMSARRLRAVMLLLLQGSNAEAAPTSPSLLHMASSSSFSLSSPSPSMPMRAHLCARIDKSGVAQCTRRGMSGG